MNSKNKTQIINRLSIVVLLSLLTTAAHAKINRLDSTRLISTAGTGIGSVLLNEAAFLNPASIYFFKKSSLYYQNGSTNLEESSEFRSNDYKEGKNEVFEITDTSARLKGAFSYQTQSENGETRKRITSSASNHLDKNTSFGVLYRYTEDKTDRHNVFHQAVFGLTHIHDKRLSYGLILEDPFLANRVDTKLAAGFQYSLTGNFIVMGDAGANYNDEPEENNFWRSAVQVQFFQHFFLKYGIFEDSIENLRGNAYGLSWIGPRLGIEYAYRKSSAFNDSENFYKDENLEEHSLAFSVVF